MMCKSIYHEGLGPYFHAVGEIHFEVVRHTVSDNSFYTFHYEIATSKCTTPGSYYGDFIKDKGMEVLPEFYYDKDLKGDMGMDDAHAIRWAITQADAIKASLWVDSEGKPVKE